MYDMMAKGCKIEIVPFKRETKDYAMSTFWMDGDMVWSWNRYFGNMARPDMTKDVFNDHVDKMIADGFKISVYT